METGLSEFVKPKVVEKVFTLPLVTDTYDSLTKLSTPLYSYVEKAGAIASPVVDCAFTIKDDIEGKMPEVVQSGLTCAKGQVIFKTYPCSCCNRPCRRWSQPPPLWMPASVQGSTAWWTRCQLSRRLLQR